MLVTWTDGNGTWQSLALAQDIADTVRWRGTLPLAGVNQSGFAYMVQAVSGVGLVAVDDNNGAYYGLGTDATDPTEEPEYSVLELDTPQTEATVGDLVTVGATLYGRGPLAGAVVDFRIGDITRSTVTDEDGHAQVTLRLDMLPNTYPVGATYRGTKGYTASSAVASTTTRVVKLPTTLRLNTASVSIVTGADSGIVATLKDAHGRALLGAPVFFVVSGTGVPNGTMAVARKTDFAGTASLGTLALPVGTYGVRVYFGTSVPAPVNTSFDEPFYVAAPIASATVRVQTKPTWNFSGFYAPVVNPPGVNSANAGQAVPMKWSLGGDRGTNIFEVGNPASQSINCSTRATTGPLQPIASPGNSGLKYDRGSGTYQLNWKTDKAWSNSCRQFVVRFTDGQTQVAYFSFKK